MTATEEKDDGDDDGDDDGSGIGRSVARKFAPATVLGWHAPTAAYPQHTGDKTGQ